MVFVEEESDLRGEGVPAVPAPTKQDRLLEVWLRGMGGPRGCISCLCGVMLIEVFLIVVIVLDLGRRDLVVGLEVGADVLPADALEELALARDWVDKFLIWSCCRTPDRSVLAVRWWYGRRESDRGSQPLC
jgi:hypothetical protein